jgi:hypothetical protein
MQSSCLPPRGRFLSAWLPVLLVTIAVAAARDTTLVVSSALTLAELTVQSNQTARILCWKPSGGELQLVKSGVTLRFTSSTGLTNLQGNIPSIAGPATVRLLYDNLSGTSSLCTVQVTEGEFQLDKAVVVPAGSGGAQIRLESSTDLVTWVDAAQGTYTNLSSQRFFRIRAERIP